MRDRCSPTWWEAVQHLSRSRITEPLRSSSRVGSVPGVVPLKTVMHDLDAHELREQWQAQTHSPTRGASALSAVFGVEARGPVRADPVADGPHTLLAGITGSKKSRLLISWLTQLALNQAPDHLTLALVDYRGGAALGLLAGLPYMARALTDLDPADTQRALSSLKAEVRHRERILATHDTKDLSCLPPQVVVPDLAVAVDEFATSAGEHAEVLELLMHITAQGRNLSIHLILATQHPQGAVSPTIRASASLRVCLRMLDAVDSRDVLGHDGAVRIGHHPGRVLVSGADGAQESAPDRQGLGDEASGAPSSGSQVLQAPWCGSVCKVQGIVDLISCAAQGHTSPRRLWAPALPASISAAEALELVRLRDPRAPGDYEKQGADGVLTPTKSTDHAGLPGCDDDHLLLAVTDLPRQQSLRL